MCFFLLYKAVCLFLSNVKFDMFVQVEERVRKKGKDFQKQKTGSVLSFKVSFRE